MIKWIQKPKKTEVARYVDCYWFLKKDDRKKSDPYPKLNPDPAGHLILSPNEQDYFYSSKYISIEGKGSHWLFPHKESFHMDHSNLSLILGVKFKIGGLYPLQLNSSRPALDQVLEADLKTLFGARAIKPANLLSLAEIDLENCCARLDELLQILFMEWQRDRHFNLTQRALELIGKTTVSKLGELLNCSQRTLERSFIKVTGLTLKQCQSMNRLEVLLEYLYLHKDTIDWADVAYRFGFSDQPHLIRHLKNNIGATPGAYQQQRNLTIDIYGGVGVN